MFKPRYYQTDSCESLLRSLENKEHPLLILATGTGKTEIAGMLISRLNKLGKNVLIVAHRGFLLDQAETKIFKHIGVRPSREQGKLTALWGNGNVTASVQTLRGNRLKNIDPNTIDYIIVDECHRSTANSYQNIFKHFNNAQRIGLTATADRPDKKNLFPIYTQIAYQYSLSKAIKDDFLCKIIGKKVQGFNIDLSNLIVRDGDFSSEDELGKVIEKYLGPIASNIQKETTDRKKILLFMPNVHSSKMIAEVMQSMGLSADYVSGDRKDNAVVLARFAAGEIQYLASCMLLVEGYDEPEIDCVVMLRPTLSRIVYSQGVGRGTRIYPGKKNLLLLEFTYNSNNHKLVTAYELLDDAFDNEIIEEAKKSGSHDGDFLENLEEAKKTFYSIDSILERSTMEDYQFKPFNPLDISKVIDIDIENERDVWFKGQILKGDASFKQKELLNRYMIDTNNMSKNTASILLSSLMEKDLRPHNGEATSKQVSYLRKLYRQDMPQNLTKAAASLLINTKLET